MSTRDSYVRCYEIRDPLYGLVSFNQIECALIDSGPLQRLRSIHQLAMTYLLYAGATHRRFEHALGTMHLAGEIFDRVFQSIDRSDITLDAFDYERMRTTVRAAGLCHDIGHLPFSHAAEHHLLPSGWSHERLTVGIINDDLMAGVWLAAGIDKQEVAEIATGQGETPWRYVVSGEAFGADRMDYLLRDSLHLGVQYGVIDHHRLTSSIRLLPFDGELVLGVTEGGLATVEALLFARRSMFDQVYCHPVRRTYDRLLQEFMSSWLPGGQYPTDVRGHQSLNDDAVLVAIRDVALDEEHPANAVAVRILDRGRFRRDSQFSTNGLINPPLQREVIADFPVQLRSGEICGACELSETLRFLTGYVDVGGDSGEPAFGAAATKKFYRSEVSHDSDGPLEWCRLVPDGQADSAR